VVADLLADATANAKLRALVYDTVRAQGYEPDAKADVTGAATSAGAMQAGSVSSEEAPLEALRKALGVALLVRVKAEGADKARVVVVMERGAKSRVVDAPAAAAEQPVTSAVSAMLAEIAPNAAAEARPEPTGSPIAAGVMAPAPPARRGVQTEEEEAIGPAAIRERWQARGGLRVSYEVRAMGTGLLLPDTPYQDVHPISGAVERGKDDTFGVGGGIGVRLSLMYLPLSQPHKGGDTWAAFRVGVGVDGNVLYYRTPIGYDYKMDFSTLRSKDTEYDDQAWLYGVVPMQLGFHVGFGKYRSDTVWRGTGIGLAYSPAFIYALEIGKTVGDVDFNYGGIEASIDIIMIEANREGSSDMQIRLAAMLLPRVRDSLPWLVSAGIGVVWY
jgi:hypothetical protein